MPDQKLLPITTRLPIQLKNELFEVQLDVESRLNRRFSKKEDYFQFVFQSFITSVREDKMTIPDSHLMPVNS